MRSMRVVCNPAPSSTIKEASYILIVKAYNCSNLDIIERARGDKIVRFDARDRECEGLAMHNLYRLLDPRSQFSVLT